MKKVLILFGGNSFEHNISCKSVNFIIKNIDLKKFKYNLVGIDYDNKWYEVNETTIDEEWKNKNIKEVNNITSYLKEFDIVFPIIHGNTGEDGKLQSLFELFNIKYVGCNSYSSLICYDKLLTKLVLEKYNISQIPYFVYNKELDLNKISYPSIVKPAKCGSSIGISVVNNKKELTKAIKYALKFDNNIIIEKYIKNNRELECAILENKDKLIVSDIGEIVKKDMWYDYDLKYKTKIDTMISDIDKEIKKEIQNISKNIFKILKCSNLSRVDFIYDIDNKKLYFNEINTMPGFTEISMYPKLIKNNNISFKDLITCLLNR